jgi:TRAP-type C4-dicarboxylate transport system permease small subunit
MPDDWRERGAILFRRIDKILLFVSNIALVVLVATICWTVWSRYVLRTPLPWAEDITSITFGWFIFIGMAAVHDRRGHVSIDIVTSALSPRLQSAIARLGDIIVVIFCAYTAYLCAKQAIVSHATAHTPVLALPLSYLFASLTIGFALMSIRSLGYLAGIAPISMQE